MGMRSNVIRTDVFKSCICTSRHMLIGPQKYYTIIINRDILTNTNYTLSTDFDFCSVKN